MTQRTQDRRPSVVAFDVVGTLFSLEPLSVRMKEAGFPDSALAEWFSRFLHAAVALDIADIYAPFREVAVATLEVMATERELASPKSVAEKIVQATSELPAHRDARPAFQGLRDAGIRIIALTNGSAQTTQHLLKQAALAFGTSNYSETVNRALSEGIRIAQVRGLGDLLGSGIWHGNLATMRRDAPKKTRKGRKK